MKIGFLLNMTFLLCFVLTQLLIWVLDGTIVRTFAELINMRPYVFDRNELKGVANQTVGQIYHYQIQLRQRFFQDEELHCSKAFQA